MKYKELLLCIREEMGQLEMDGEYIVFQDEYQRDVQLMGVMEKAVIDYSYGDPAKERLEESKRRERDSEILRAWNDGVSVKRLAEIHGLSSSRIRAIIVEEPARILAAKHQKTLDNIIRSGISVSLRETDLSYRVRQALEGAGCETTEQLFASDVKHLRRLRSFGRVSLIYVKQFARRYGHELADVPYEEWNPVPPWKRGEENEVRKDEDPATS
jgi:hypothetical protein